MSDVKQGFGADMLARLRGVGTGGVQAPQPKPQDQQPQGQPIGSVMNQEPQPQGQPIGSVMNQGAQPQGQPIGSVMNQAPAEEEKPKRDIQELYDFIDAYCSGDSE